MPLDLAVPLVLGQLLPRHPVVVPWVGAPQGLKVRGTGAQVEKKGIEWPEEASRAMGWVKMG